MKRVSANKTRHNTAHVSRWQRVFRAVTYDHAPAASIPAASGKPGGRRPPSGGDKAGKGPPTTATRPAAGHRPTPAPRHTTARSARATGHSPAWIRSFAHIDTTRHPMGSLGAHGMFNRRHHPFCLPPSPRPAPSSPPPSHGVSHNRTITQDGSAPCGIQGTCTVNGGSPTDFTPGGSPIGTWCAADPRASRARPAGTGRAPHRDPVERPRHWLRRLGRGAVSPVRDDVPAGVAVRGPATIAGRSRPLRRAWCSRSRRRPGTTRGRAETAGRPACGGVSRPMVVPRCRAAPNRSATSAGLTAVPAMQPERPGDGPGAARPEAGRFRMTVLAARYGHSTALRPEPSRRPDVRRRP